jgi:signal transduction histidine kinase
MASLAVGSTALLTLFTVESNSLFVQPAYDDMLELRTIQEMELALAHHQGLLTTSIADRNQRWLEELDSFQKVFQDKLESVFDHSDNKALQSKIRKIERDYNALMHLKERIVEDSRQGMVSQIQAQLSKYRSMLSELLDSSAQYRQQQWNALVQKRARNKTRAEQLSVIEIGAVLSYLALTGILILVLMRQVLRPVRLMARETGGDQNEAARDEVKSLSSSLHSFIQDFDHTHKELARSREHLEQAEKMAMVGKLAAGVAHSIRNPFTSIKMRLFSLSRNLELSEAHKEDFEVVSEEIGRIDTIVQNFLEFARPPKIRMQICQCSEVVDAVLQILKHRLQAFNIEVKHDVQGEIPPIHADPERFKEALINLVINACEAIESGGIIEISESVRTEEGSRMLAVQVRDDGPGVVESVQDKILQPFFTTKEEGTGLGLSIVAQIVREHQGRLEVSSTPGKGASFTIVIPVSRENEHEFHTDH